MDKTGVERINFDDLLFQQLFGDDNGSSIASSTERLSSEAQEVCNKVGKVYAYVAASLALTAVTSFVSAKIGVGVCVLTLLVDFPIAIIPIFFIAMGIITSLHATKQPEQKLALFGGFALFEGVFLSPLALINGSAFLTASLVTSGIIGGLGALAMTMKESFERYEKILGVALVAIAGCSLGALILPGALSVAAHDISLFGGLALFSAYTIYDTHVARSKALEPGFSEIDHSLGIYLNGINILVRLWELYNSRK